MSSLLYESGGPAALMASLANATSSKLSLLRTLKDATAQRLLTTEQIGATPVSERTRTRPAPLGAVAAHPPIAPAPLAHLGRTFLFRLVVATSAHLKLLRAVEAALPRASRRLRSMAPRRLFKFSAPCISRGGVSSATTNNQPTIQHKRLLVTYSERLEADRHLEVSPPGGF